MKSSSAGNRISSVAFPHGSISIQENEQTDEATDLTRPWVVIVWDDPVNLMAYVTYVFQKLFGYPKPKAEKLMLDVHHKGKAVVAKGSREKAELDVFRLHKFGLSATMQMD
mgnify:FL=1|tara:strand:- start:329 stop:661 length:333 start_codon:yes stop_codon:yes gene_type:complete